MLTHIGTRLGSTANSRDAHVQIFLCIWYVRTCNSFYQICVYMQDCVRTCWCRRAQDCMQTRLRLHADTLPCLYTCTLAYVCVCVCVCVCVHVCVGTSMHYKGPGGGGKNVSDLGVFQHFGHCFPILLHLFSRFRVEVAGVGFGDSVHVHTYTCAVHVHTYTCAMHVHTYICAMCACSL